ncbi:hypothetical protein BKA63DRAFT_4047 [Paraphoma chrysanthemicola]|nr:hypothetical protein BKA63DRAFT_4047 [Paraphoma chrysanthemicola]
MAKAKAKRMSDMFASSAENDAEAGITTATPPYSSDGPTLPLIDGEDATKINASRSNTSALATTASKKKIPDAQKAAIASNGRIDRQLGATMHPSLYEPWKLLPIELLQLAEVKLRIKGAQTVLPIVFTKNQNVKGGINRLKTLLGAYRDLTNPIEMPEVLGQKDVIIAISAQGEGTSKLISILDMVRRIVAPHADEQDDAGTVESWWLYTSLASVEVDMKDAIEGNGGDPSNQTQDTDEDAFEPMEVDLKTTDRTKEKPTTRKTPVLTAWMTKKPISSFKKAFGEQPLTVQTLPTHD